MTRTLSRQADHRIDQIRALVRSAGATTSVYLHGSDPGAGENDLSLRWATLRARLTDLGTPAADLAEIGPVVTATPSGDHARVAFAADGRVRLRALLDHFDGPDIAVFGRWPRAMPLLRWQQQRTPAVAAVVTHGHAEALGYDDDGALVLTEEIAGHDDEIENNAPGGWAQPRYQRRAVDSWQHNAEQFATHLASVAARVQPLVVLLAGDVRETMLVRAQLPDPLRRLVVDATARPGADGALHVSTDDVRAAVLGAAQQRRAQQLAAFDDAAGRGLAVEGPTDVLQALDQGRVERLVLVDQVVADVLADTAIAAALDAESQITIAEPSDLVLVGGIGATLRF